MIKSILIYFGIFILLFAVFAFSMDRLLRSPGWKGPVSRHFDGKKFHNIGEEDRTVTEEEHTRWDALKWMITRDKAMWEKREVKQVKPVERVAGKELHTTFINHATVLIQTEGLNVLTDPMYGRRASPVSFAGPKRYTEPGVAFDDLPPIDIVIISHNHYDHMDIETLQRIKEKWDPVILVPLGNKDFLKSKDIDAAELDWWSVFSMEGDVSITLVPGQHFSARSISDRNETLWGGYVIETPHGDIYFAGDTGYGPFIEEIAKHFEKGFRLGLLPIGAFKPEWFMSEVHVGPQEAVNMMRDLKVENAVAIHFGTFKLADDEQDEPSTYLDTIRKAEKIDSFVALPNGGNLILK